MQPTRGPSSTPPSRPWPPPPGGPDRTRSGTWRIVLRDVTDGDETGERRRARLLAALSLGLVVLCVLGCVQVRLFVPTRCCSAR